jgi:hypothetical protein
MPFPYMGVAGALIAGMVLGSTITLFAVALRALDRSVTRVGDSILSGLVSGFHGWSEARRVTMPPVSPGAASATESPSPISTELVQRR